VVASYLQRVNEREAARNPNIAALRDSADMTEARAGDQSIRVRSAEVLDAEGAAINHAETGTTFCVRVKFTAAKPVLGPNVRIALQHDTGPLVAMLSNHRIGEDFGTVDGENTVDISLVNNPLLPGRYRVHIDVFDHTGSRILDTWNDAVEFAVRSQGGEIGQGFVDLPCTFHLTRG
jgi:hypothetical protein